MILLIDNYDSFTWNLVHRIGELDRSLNVRVVRNDELTPDQAVALAPTHLIISPGPCTPDQSGASRDLLRAFAGNVPILGVCLGHQCIGDVFGMRVDRAPAPVHGKTALINHDGRGIFENLPNPFVATRYHSLIVTPDSIDTQRFDISAWTDEDDPTNGTRRIVQGLRKKPESDTEAPIDGVQFHPESFLTTDGPHLLANFLGLPAPTRAHA